MVVKMVRDAFPDYWVRIDLIAAEADRVGPRGTIGRVARWQISLDLFEASFLVHLIQTGCRFSRLLIFFTLHSRSNRSRSPVCRAL